jgi:hypothetical protein
MFKEPSVLVLSIFQNQRTTSSGYFKNLKELAKNYNSFSGQLFFDVSFLVL